MPRRKSQAEKAAARESRSDRRSQRPPSGDLFSLLMDLIANRFSFDGEVAGHVRNAELELLKALKVFIEKQIKQLEKRAQAARSPRVEKVDIT